jgi:hypothetical protein
MPWAQAEEAASISIEEATKGGRTIEVRQAAPIY